MRYGHYFFCRAQSLGGSPGKAYRLPSGAGRR
jgi:hypothetical protein